MISYTAQTPEKGKQMSKSFISLLKNAFSPLSEGDYRAYRQYVNPDRNSYDVSFASVESIVGEGDPSLSEGSCLGLKQQRMMRNAVYVHA